jgi:hypothetical protein
MLWNDAWTISHLLTIAGYSMTAFIAFFGFRSFNKWKREQIEGRRIDIALEALALAYEAESVFASIRGPMFTSEWPELTDIEDPDRRRAAASYFGVLKRLEHHKDYFERVWKVQPRFMAVFGKDRADVFKRVHEAHSNIFFSAIRLMKAAKNGELYGDTHRQQYRERLENDVYNADEDSDRIAPKVKEFVVGVEKCCLPLVTHSYANGRS